MKDKLLLISTPVSLLILWISHFFMDVAIGFWSVYKTLASLDLAIAGIIAGVSPFIGEGMQVFFGSLGDRGYRKGLLIFGLGACAFATLIPYTDHYFLLFLLFLVVCIGSGAFHPTAVAVTSGLTQKRKGLFVTIFASGGALGLALSHLIFSYWYLHFDGKTLILSLPVLMMMGLILCVEIPGVVHQPAPQGRRFGLSAMKQLFRCRELVILYISQVCNQALFWALIFFLPDILLAKGYESWICFGGGHFFFIFGGAIMMIPGGFLSDKYSPKLILLTSSFLGSLLYYSFLLTPEIPASWMILILFLLGACLGLANPVAVAYGNRIMPSRPGLVSAFLMGLVWCVSEGLGPGGGGLLTKCFVENAPVKALSLFGVLFIVGMGSVSRLPEEITEEVL